jgi:predicted double-glycine peptidase
MWKTSMLWIGILFLIGMIFQSCAVQARRPPVTVMPVQAGPIRGEKPVRSWKELRDQYVVMQSFDYSCGAAALATLMRYYFGDNVSEEEILIGILGSMSREEVQDREKNGLSLLDLKICAERMGYQAAGVSLDYISLPKLKGPVLIHLETKEYRHFAVLKGVREDRVFLADPSRGNVRISVDRFAKEWSGVALVLGKRGFGLPQDYPLALGKQQPVQNEILAARRSLFTR